MRQSLISSALLWPAILVGSAVLLAPGCATRSETPTVAPDSTLVYAAKRAGDVNANITFSSRISKKSGKRLGVGRAFDMEEGAKVIAFIDLENPHGRGDRPLMFHLIWLNPAQKAVYRKVIEYTPNDSSATLTSNLTISPQKRSPGYYNLRVYLFRELIAEKSFELRGDALVPLEKDQGKDMM